MEDGQILISVGQIIPRKGHDLLLRAAAGLPCHLYIIGGEATADLQALMDELGMDKVHFIPFVDKMTLQRYYQAADVLVLATRFDIWGLVINEAMAQGLPVITTRQCVAGVELVEEGRNGFLVDAENVAELAERIRTLLSCPDLQRQFGERSYRKMMDYTIEKMAQRHFEILCNT